MVIDIVKDDEWTLEPKEGGHINISFASVSAKDYPATISIYEDDELVDEVHFNAPHSWWIGTYQSITKNEPLTHPHKLIVKASRNDITFRVDYKEYAPRS